MSQHDTNEQKLASQPVSYTHLDVYKRQLLGLFYLVDFVHLIVIIVGVVASRDRIFRPPLALPFFGVTRGV